MTAKVSGWNVPASVARVLKEWTSRLARLGKNLRQPRILLPFIVGAAIRFAFAPFTEQRWDMYTWRIEQVLVYNYHVNPFWPQSGVPLQLAWSYPPLWLLTLLALYPVYSRFYSPQLPVNISVLWQKWAQTGNVFEIYRSFVPVGLPILDLIDKTPIVVADLLIALVLYELIKRDSPKHAYYALIAWLFNPYVIWISSVWGMFDAIPALLMLLSVYLLIARRYKSSAILLVASALFKLYAIVLIPIMSLIIYKRGEKAKALRYFLFSTLVVLIATFMAYAIAASLAGQNPLSLAVQLSVNLFYKRASPDMLGQNLFQNLTPLTFLNQVFADLHVSTNIPISPILMSTAVILLGFQILRSKSLQDQEIIAYVVIAHFITYLTYSVVNEQYLVWVLPLILVLAAKKNSVNLRHFYWAISGFFILDILYRYDLSYFISPYISPMPPEIRIPVYLLIEPLIVITVYAIGIKLATGKSNKKQ
ncbi:MAG: hypothetical protein WCD81_03290 [Candidatus Bathyarchaeia archaeon]